MFIELTFYSTEEKIIMNINNIDTIYQGAVATDILVGGVVYAVKESYEDIAKCIDKYYNS